MLQKTKAQQIVSWPCRELFGSLVSKYLDLLYDLFISWICMLYLIYTHRILANQFQVIYCLRYEQYIIKEIIQFWILLIAY